MIEGVLFEVKEHIKIRKQTNSKKQKTPNNIASKCDMKDHTLQV